MKILSFILLIVPSMAGVCQNISYDWINIKLYRPPLHPLAVDQRTFSVAIVDLGNQLGSADIEHLRQNIILPGVSRVLDNPAVKLEVVFSGASITSKELNDKPRTMEKDGIKTVYHQYHYLLNCSFPTKLRLNVNGQYIEQDLPAFFQIKYHGRNKNDENAFSDEYERDHAFRHNIYRKSNPIESKNSIRCFPVSSSL